MLKNILLKTSELVNRDDIVSALKEADSIEDIDSSNISIEISKMISYCNYILNDIFENYIFLEKKETTTSNENGEICYSNLNNKPIKIISVKSTQNTNLFYNIHSTYISTNIPNQTFIIHYCYAQNELSNFEDQIELPINLNYKTICYGIASEFLASKDQFEKSEFWKTKYLYEIFKLKIKKERRLKSTFCK